MNPHTGQTTPINSDRLLFDAEAEYERAAELVDCAVEDLMVVTGKQEHIDRVSKAVKAQNRAKNKRARKQRKANNK